MLGPASPPALHDPAIDTPLSDRACEPADPSEFLNSESVTARNSCPPIAQLIQSGAFRDFVPLLPADLLPVPMVPGGRGHRVRVKWKRARDISLLANDIIRSLNALDSGLSTSRTQRQTRVPSFSASKNFYARVLSLAASTASVRRDCGLSKVTGAQATSTIIKADITDRYSYAIKSFSQVPMSAAALDEPGVDSSCVDLLSALPLDEAEFYRSEKNVVDLSTKSQVLFSELQSRYNFVGGEYREYVQYFNRTDICADLWDFQFQDTVKCVCGFSVVPKKDPAKQRKLLMTVAQNYLWCSAKERSSLGMSGGAGLAATFASDGHAHISSWDQSNAFTAVKTPSWFWSWHAVPPVRAGDVWDRLSPQVRARATTGTWLYPCYKRLAMGSSHSVHLLMTLNLETVGRTLAAGARMGKLLPPPSSVALDSICEPATCLPCCEDLYDADWTLPDCWTATDTAQDLLPDEDAMWADEQRRKRVEALPTDDVLRPNTLQEFIDVCRRVKQLPERVFVVLHLFSGKRRQGDYEDQVRKLATLKGLRVLIVSVDLGSDVAWDVTEAGTFHSLITLAKEGLIDAVGGGPPCGTWSKLRFRPHGPRPLRFDWCPWGRPDVSAVEHDRLCEGNTLMVHFLALCEAIARRGGLYWLEHPADPDEEPMPSIWRTEAYLAFEKRVRGRRCRLDQCAFGGPTVKPTTVSNNVGLPRCGPRCPGNHVHGLALGRTKDGRFRSQRLAQYPQGLCEWLAEHVVDVFSDWLNSGAGPTGWLKRSLGTVVEDDSSVVRDVVVDKHMKKPGCQEDGKWYQDSHMIWKSRSGSSQKSRTRGCPDQPVLERSIDYLKSVIEQTDPDLMSQLPSVRSTYWSHEGVPGLTKSLYMINEHGKSGKRAIVNSNSNAFYLHVDDGIVLSASADEADHCMNLTGDSLEDVGFSVKDRNKSSELSKTLGYTVLHDPPGFEYPREKAELLRIAMRRAVSQPRVQVEALRSLLGIWLFGALLRRELLSVASSIFKFVEVKQEGVHAWWPSARREFLHMSNLVCFMRVNIALPDAPVMFATDAQGHNDASTSDFGGFGIVGSDITKQESLELWAAPFTPGLSVCRLDGTLSSRWHERGTLTPTIPFSRLPGFVFDRDWSVCAAGRWRMADHITAGEARGHFKCIQCLAAVGSCHSQRYVFLQDNFPVASSMTKGRATSPVLNYYCRRRAAACLSAEIYSALPWCQSALMPADEASRLSADALAHIAAGCHGGIFKPARPTVPGRAHQEQGAAGDSGQVPEAGGCVHVVRS